MSGFEQLPIYRRMYDLLLHLETTVHGFSRPHKYGLGVRLQHGAQGLLERVNRVQNSTGEGRIREVEALRVEVEVLKNLLHLANEVEAFRRGVPRGTWEPARRAGREARR